MEQLHIYQTAMDLTSKIYLLTQTPRLKKDCSLCDQIRRASISIVTNIAEGYKRSRRHFLNYLQIASGSSNEVVALLQIINTVYKINTDELQNSFKILGRQINSFSNKIKTNGLNLS